jgi:site-specific DNA recombinase
LEFRVPAIIDESTFNEVQALQQSRSLKRTPPRVVNGPTFLAGIARCGYCGAAMIQNTGKGGLYCCSSKLKKGPSACRGIRTPMEKLDEIVVGEVARQVLDPDRLAAMLDAYVQSATVQAVGAKAQLAKLRHDHTAAVAGIARLLELVEKGLMEAEDPSMREGLISRSPSTTDVACNGIKGGGADTGPSRAASNRVPSAQLRHTQPDWQSPLESRLRPNLLGRHLRHHHPRHFRI